MPTQIQPAAGAQQPDKTAPKPAGFNSLSSEQFIKILTSELSRQDPLAPNDSKAILEQISSIRSIESNLSLKKSLESLVQQNQFASAGALIGKRIEGLDTDLNKVTGIVKSVGNTKDGAELVLRSGHRVAMKDVLQIFDGATAGASEPAAAGAPGPAPGAIGGGGR